MPSSTPRFAATAAAAVLLTSLLAACGKVDGPAAQAPATTATAPAVAAAQDAPGDAATAIRAALGERLPQLPPIQEISPTPVAGLYEVRLGDADIVYTDARGDFLVQGQLFDTQQRRNLTEERLNKLTAIQFADLPLDDAFTFVRGDGSRKLAVFADPNCGYCKRFERDLESIDNVTVYVFLYPILGADSLRKSQHVWCAKDRAGAWSDWMLRGQPIPAAECDSAAVQRNVALGRKHKITGTPTLLFTNDERVPGALPAAEVERLLASASAGR